MKKNMQIEGLRGLACLMIVLFHTLYQFQVYVLETSGFTLLSLWGEIGVVIFLFISGFYMVNFADERSFSLRQFYKRRILRLWPIYVVCVTIIFLVRIFTHVPNFDAVTWKDFLLNICFINGFVSTSYIEPAHWYMTSLLRAILVVGILRKTRLHKYTETYGVWLCLIVLLKVLQRIFTNSIVLTIIRSILMITGGAYTGVFVLAFLMRKLFGCENLHELVSPKHIKEFLVVALSLVYLIALPGARYTLIVILGGTIVWLCLNNKLPFMNNKVFLAISKISFVWYLIHQYMAYLIEMTILSWGLNLLIAGIVAAIITMLMAIVIHCFIEEPINKKMRKIV